MKLHPSDRVRYTGHTKRLGDPWIHTVGYWCVFNTDEILGENGVINPNRGSFDQFKRRHGLKTRRQFEASNPMARRPWFLAGECYARFENAKQELGPDVTLGILAAWTVSKWPLGVLPVELLMWRCLFSEFLEQHGLTLKTWGTLVKDDVIAADRLWLAGYEGEIWDVRRFFKDPKFHRLISAAHDRAAEASGAP